MLEQDDSLFLEENFAEAFDIVVSKADLVKSLAHVQSAVEKRNTYPILANVKLEARGSTLAVTATDTDMSITDTIESTVKEEGAITVPAHTLYEIARKMPQNADIILKISKDRKAAIDIISGNTYFSLPTLPVTEYPNIALEEVNYEVKISGGDLKLLIDKTKFSVCDEETRYYLNGLYLHLKQEDGNILLAAVGMDGHRLSAMQVALKDAGSFPEQGIIISKKTAYEISRLLDEAAENVILQISNTKIALFYKNITFIAKLIDATYPSYQDLIPVHENYVVFDRKTLLEAVDRVATITLDKENTVMFNYENQDNKIHLRITAYNDQNGTGGEVVDILEFKTSAIVTQALNARYVVDALSSVSSDKVKYFYDDSEEAIKLEKYEDASQVYVLMPMEVGY